MAEDYTPLYTNLDTVKRLLRSAKFNVTIAPASPVAGTNYNFTQYDALEFVRDAEEEITVAVSERYLTPLSLVVDGIAAKRLGRMAARLSVFYVYEAAFPSVSQNDFPAVLLGWRDSVQAVLKGLADGTLGLPGCEQTEPPKPLVSSHEWPHEVEETDDPEYTA